MMKLSFSNITRDGVGKYTLTFGPLKMERLKYGMRFVALKPAEGVKTETTGFFVQEPIFKFFGAGYKALKNMIYNYSLTF
jgi:hypothetical protein